MKRAVAAAVFGLFGLSIVAPAMAQERLLTPNPRIIAKYNPPATAKYQALYGRLQQRKVLETLQVFLAPLILPEDLRIETAECGIKEGAPPYKQYLPGSPVTICYEFVELVEGLAPDEVDDDELKEYQIFHYSVIGPIFVDRDTAIVGPVIHELLHNVALAVFDIYKVPIWGRVEDAADDVAALLMLQFGTDTALKTVRGAAWFLVQSNEKHAPSGSYKYSYLGAVRPPEMQRYYNLICIAIGGNLDKFGNFVAIGREAAPFEMADRQAASCQIEYQKVAGGFRATIFDKHIDQELFKAMRNVDWLNRQ